MATVGLHSVHKSYGKVPAIQGVSVDIPDGEFLTLVGPSGCGKSTLLRMIAGLESITAGEIRIDGRRVNERSAAQRGLAMVFQSYALYPHMTVRQNLAFGLENVRTPRPEIERRVAEAARMLQIEPLLARRPRQLSGGQRQRVAIGRAVVREPKIFLFDEPLSNLDAELRVQMRVELAGLHGRLGNTMVYVTHDQVEAMTMADQIVVMNGGRIEQSGAPLELYDRPANLFVAGFIGSPAMNLLPGRAADGGFRTDGGAILPLPPHAPANVATYGIRPEHLVLAEDGIPATIVLVEPTGSETQVSMRIGDTPVIGAFRERVTGRPGDTLRIMPDLSLVHLFGPDGRRL